MKFRKKPVVIDAVQWDGENYGEVVYVMVNNTDIAWNSVVGSKLYINTLEGVMTADVGDWIIRGVAGEIYPCKPDIFEKTYEIV